jgi:putative nucleotidyltransferase with HDIG domain
MLLVSLAGYGLLAWLTAAFPVPKDHLLIVLWKAGFFLALAILVGLNPVKLPRGGATTTVGFAVDFGCLLIFGPAIASWIGVVSFLVLLRRSPWLRQVFNHGQVILSFSAAGWVYTLLGGKYVVAQGQVAYEHLVLALLGSCLTYFLVSSTLLAEAMALWEHRSVSGMWILNFRWAAPQYVALAPFGLLMAMVYQAYQSSQAQYLDIIAVSLFLVPLVGARYAFQGAMEMLQVHRETVYALSNALEAYDPYTRNHSELVTRYALQLGKELGLAAARMETLEWAGRLHDIGKCRQDWESIIRKPGKPSEREWQIIRQHPIEGARLAEKMEFLPHTAGVVATLVRAHHERINGSGYPDGLKGEEIPLEARILGVADAFEAMTARRAYRPRRSVEEAVAEIQQCAGTQFDEQVVQALVVVWQRGALDMELGSATEQPALTGLSYHVGGAT